MNQQPADHPSFQDQPSQPIVDIRRSMVKPYATYAIMGITILVYILQAVSDLLTSYDYPFLLGGKINQFIMAGEFWRLITPVLLHGSIFHLAINMYALYSLGGGLESFYGHKRFVILYLCGAFAGNVLSFFFTVNPSLGSSTAIFGLLAAEGIFVITNRKFFGSNYQRMIINIGGIALVNLMIGLTTDRIDNWGHLGGLLGGGLFAYIAGPRWEVRGFQNSLEIADTQDESKIWLGAASVLVIFSLITAYKFFA
jgi:rhomboid protease GluP